MRIPLYELIITFSRSGGAGGQNVNKTSTKATVRWHVGRSSAFNAEEKIRIRQKLINRLNSEDEIIVVSEEERSQSQNRQKAVMKLQSLVALAIKVPHKRRPTAPTRASKTRRLDTKKKHSVTKTRRRGFFDW